MGTNGKEPSWKPVRKGAAYCSPACGGGCRHADYMTAQLAATRLAHRLGPDWTPRVWENLGWHYSVDRGAVSVRRSHRGFTAYAIGLEMGVMPQSAPRPRVAVARLQRLVRGLLDEMERRYDAAFGEGEKR